MVANARYVDGLLRPGIEFSEELLLSRTFGPQFVGDAVAYAVTDVGALNDSIVIYDPISQVSTIFSLAEPGCSRVVCIIRCTLHTWRPQFSSSFSRLVFDRSMVISNEGVYPVSFCFENIRGIVCLQSSVGHNLVSHGCDLPIIDGG